MAIASISVTETPLLWYPLRRADDALILGHRLSEWCGHAPAMEEDMALANMGLDLLGQARELYSYAADVEVQGNDEDKFEKESAYHLRHSSEWMVRLGDGTEESHRRAQTAVDDLWAYTGEMFQVDENERALIERGVAVDPATLHSQWQQTVSGVVTEATLTLPKSGWM